MHPVMTNVLQDQQYTFVIRSLLLVNKILLLRNELAAL